jgi:hypothetical protein
MVFLIFSFELVLFSSNFFDLGTNFFGNQPFLVFCKRFLSLGELSSRISSSGKLALSGFWQESFSFLGSALRELHFFLQKMLITVTTAVTLLVFAVSNVISSALVLLLGAVLATLTDGNL